jgi:hypothetical protein
MAYIPIYIYQDDGCPNLSQSLIALGIRPYSGERFSNSG